MRHGKLLSMAVLLSALPAIAQAQFGGGYNDYESSPVGPQIGVYLVVGFLGLAAGALASDRFKPYRGLIGTAAIIALIWASLVTPFPIKPLLTIPAVFVIFTVAVWLGISLGQMPETSGGRKSTTFGSAQWATFGLLHDRKMVGEQGLALGYFPSGNGQVPLHYAGDRHLLTVAPTRAGKGVSAIIPNLLTYRGSVLVIDPKGENAMTTALRRGAGDADRGIEGMGQEVHVVDPWGLATETTGIQAACFNPLDWLDPDSPEIGENAMMLADSLVVPPPGGSKDPFWEEEAKALLMGFILHVATSPLEAEHRHLGRVRDMLMLSMPDFNTLLEEMLNSTNPIVASSAARTVSKDQKLQAGVISSAQSHTHFLDSPGLRESLSRSDFQFEDLKRTPTTVYLVLPADRLNPFGRWLRMLIQQAITITARNILERPERPILFMLDEMAALGRLTMVEQAYSLMAGFGMQLWGIVQDLSQLHRIYGDGWQTFIGNAGVLQYFGSRDQMTAEYFSALCGQATVTTLSSSINKAFTSSKDGGSSSTSTSHTHGETQRKLIMADELMRVPANVQLILVENLDPIAGRKIEWYSDERFRKHGVNLRGPVAPDAPPLETTPWQRPPEVKGILGKLMGPDPGIRD